MASFIEDFPIQRQARAKCNREVGSQIENLRVVIVITDWRFILLDSFNRSGVFASTYWPCEYNIYFDFVSTTYTLFRNKRFMFYDIDQSIHYGEEKVARNKKRKNYMSSVFIFQKYGKFWSISLDHFIKHKPPISEECIGWSVFVFKNCF